MKKLLLAFVLLPLSTHALHVEFVENVTRWECRYNGVEIAHSFCGKTGSSRHEWVEVETQYLGAYENASETIFLRKDLSDKKLIEVFHHELCHYTEFQLLRRKRNEFIKLSNRYFPRHNEKEVFAETCNQVIFGHKSLFIPNRQLKYFFTKLK